MNNVERYEALMTAALEAKQLKIELKRKLAEMGKIITASELHGRYFNSEDANKAFAILADGKVKIEERQHVKSQLIYKDVEISLHAHPHRLESDAMKHVLDELGNKEIFEA